MEQTDDKTTYLVELTQQQIAWLKEVVEMENEDQDDEWQFSTGAEVLDALAKAKGHDPFTTELRLQRVEQKVQKLDRLGAPWT